jgi:hypothetical protein
MSGVELLELPATFLPDDYVTSKENLKRKIEAFRKRNSSKAASVELNLGKHLYNLMRRANEMDPMSGVTKHCGG